MMVIILIITSIQNVIGPAQALQFTGKYFSQYTHEHIHTCIATVLLYGSARMFVYN